MYPKLRILLQGFKLKPLPVCTGFTFEVYGKKAGKRISVWVKLGLFNATIHNGNRRYIHRLIYQLNEQDLLCHSI